MRITISIILLLCTFSINIRAATSSNGLKTSLTEPLLSMLLKISILEKKGQLTEYEVNQQLQFLLKNGFEKSENLHEVLIRQELSYLRSLDIFNSDSKSSNEMNKTYLALNHVENIQSNRPHVQLVVFILKMIRYQITKQPITSFDIKTWNSLLSAFYMTQDPLNSTELGYVAESAELLARYLSFTENNVLSLDISKLIETTFDQALLQQVSQFEEKLMLEISKVRTSLPYQKSQIGFFSESNDDRLKEIHLLKIQNQYRNFLNKGLVKISGNPYQKQNIGFTCEGILKN